MGGRRERVESESARGTAEMRRDSYLGAPRDCSKFKRYPIGYFHIDIAEVRTEEGKLHLFVAIDRTSKFAFAQLHEKANRHTATAFLKALIAVVPYKIHTILTDNGIQFCDLPKNRSGPTARWQTHMFDLLCRAHGIEHRLTKPNHPWPNGQVHRMNRPIKEAPVRRYHYDSHHQLRQHIQTFLDAYNFAKRLKTLNGLTPFESVCKAWTKEPNRFKYDPVQLTSGLHMALLWQILRDRGFPNQFFCDSWVVGVWRADHGWVTRRGRSTCRD